MKPIDYSLTIMYKIVCNDLNIIDLYVGHTTQFTKRKCSHKARCNNKNSLKYNLKIYQTIRLHGGWDEWSMVMIEDYPCANKLEACKRERELFEELNATLNTNKPHKTERDWKEEYALHSMIYRAQHKDEIRIRKKEYSEQHKDEIRIRKKEYNEQHKDEIKIKKKNYREKNIEKVMIQAKLSRERNKDAIKIRKKEYNEQHKDEIKIKKRNYREKNIEKVMIQAKLSKEKHKDTIKISRSKQYECICGKILLWDHKSRHEKTICHQNFIETINKFEPEMTVVEPEMSLTEAENS